MPNQKSNPKRKVFLSFLGNTAYQECVYIDKKRPRQNSPVVKFVQEALCGLYCEDWTAEDKIVVCVTGGEDGSRAKNWVGQNGLKRRLGLLSLKPNIEALSISEGFTEAGNNAIFLEIFKTLQDGDKVYFDITNAFRSIPLFGMVLMDYTRFLKVDFEIAAVFYGAFEAMTYPNGAPIQGFEAKKAAKAEDKYVNIVHLTEMVQLQAWTTAANDFITHGNATRLSALIQPNNALLAAQLVALTQAILMCRGALIVEHIDIDNLKKELIAESQKTDIKAQLLPLIEKINEKIKTFENSSVENGFAAVEWCIQHGWVQQGYTFLQETVISYLLAKTVGVAQINIYEQRQSANIVLNGYKEFKNEAMKKEGKSQWDKVDKTTAQLVENLLKAQSGKGSALKVAFKELSGKTGLRNDINHCGYNQNEYSSETLTNDLRTIFRQIKENLF
jgi:hypothetical protein